MGGVLIVIFSVGVKAGIVWASIGSSWRSIVKAFCKEEPFVMC